MSQIVIVPGAVLALGDLAVEVQVLQRVVLGVHGQAVLAGRVGQEVRHRPRHEHAVALEAQIPVQARGGVLLDDEAALLASSAPSAPIGSGVFAAPRLAR